MGCCGGCFQTLGLRSTPLHEGRAAGGRVGVCVCVCVGRGVCARHGTACSNARTRGMCMGTFPCTRSWNESIARLLDSPQVIGGWAASRWGGKPVLLIAVLIWSAATVLTPAAAGSSIPLLLGVRVLMGLGEGVSLPTMHHLTAVWCAACPTIGCPPSGHLAALQAGRRHGEPRIVSGGLFAAGVRWRSAAASLRSAIPGSTSGRWSPCSARRWSPGGADLPSPDTVSHRRQLCTEHTQMSTVMPP